MLIKSKKYQNDQSSKYIVSFLAQESKIFRVISRNGGLNHDTYVFLIFL